MKKVKTAIRHHHTLIISFDLQQRRQQRILVDNAKIRRHVNYGLAIGRKRQFITRDGCSSHLTNNQPRGNIGKSRCMFKRGLTRNPRCNGRDNRITRPCYIKYLFGQRRQVQCFTCPRLKRHPTLASCHQDGVKLKLMAKRQCCRTNFGI